MQQRGNEANLLKEKINQLNLQLEAANSRIENLQAELDSREKVDCEHTCEGK
jgi:predicted RNase H-like nuclease (RuvC/YqgF family)